MKTVGAFLKNARIGKKVSLKSLERQTRIKKEFIEAIEREEWKDLPEFPVVSGFVKNIASALDVDWKKAVALLRRDYPPRRLAINPKPDISSGFKWGPKLGFILGVGFVGILIVGYLGFQYLRFMSPPVLEVWKPADGEVLVERDIVVEGKTGPDASVRVNNQPALVADDGTFRAEIEVTEGMDDIKVEAVSRSGKSVIVHRQVSVDFVK